MNRITTWRADSAGVALLLRDHLLMPPLDDGLEDIPGDVMLQIGRRVWALSRKVPPRRRLGS